MDFRGDIQNNDETFQRFEKNNINDNPQLPDSTVMPNQSNSSQITEPTEPTQDLDNSNSHSEEVSETPFRRFSWILNRPKYLQDYVWPKDGVKGCYKVIIVIMLLTFELIFK